MNKTIIYGSDARNRIIKGINKVENIVGSSLGPKGHNVIVYDGGIRPLITKDGATILNKVDSEEPFEKIGILLIKDIVSKVDSVAGDGTTTTTIYSSELMREVNSLINLGVDANALRKGMDTATKDAINFLKSKAEKIDDIESIARISTNENEELSQLLVKAYKSIGENGSIVLTDSYKRNGESYVVVSNGLNWKGGIPSDLFITNTADDTAVIENPSIMVLATGVKDLEPLKPYIDIARKLNRNLVFVAPYFEPVLWAQAAGAGVFLVMSPGTSLDHTTLHEALSDFAVVVGTKVVTSTENAINEVPDFEKDLGKAKLIVSSVKETKVTQLDEIDPSKAKQYEDYINKLKNSIEDDETTPTVIENLKDRLARLSGGIAEIHVGALTPIEREEKAALLVDAQNSVASALKYGVLPGGGTALLKTSYYLSKNLKAKEEFKDEAFKKGYEAVLKCLKVPAQKLVSSVKPNDYQYIVQQVAHEKDFWNGYNVRKEKVNNLKEDKVFDSAAIELFALEYSNSVIGSFVISDGVIVNSIDNIRYDVNDRSALER